MTDLFVYGSLIFPPVWQQLVTEDYSVLPAFLPGYSRSKIFFDNYPIAYPAPVSGFLGSLYLGLNKHDIRRLDHFEGEIYERVESEVMTVIGPRLAQLYLPKKRYLNLMTNVPWTPALFEECLMNVFLERYCSKH